MYARFNLRRMAKGYVDSATHAPNSTIRLSNNSNSSEMILVWDITPGAETTNPMFTAISQSAPFATTVATQPLVPGEPSPPGVVSHGSLPAAITPSWPLQAGGQAYGGMQRAMPLIVLQPGWSLDVQNDGAGAVTIGCGFMWEALLTDYFDQMYGAYERLTTGSGQLA